MFNFHIVQQSIIVTVSCLVADSWKSRILCCLMLTVEAVSSCWTWIRGPACTGQCLVWQHGGNIETVTVIRGRGQRSCVCCLSGSSWCVLGVYEVLWSECTHFPCLKWLFVLSGLRKIICLQFVFTPYVVITHHNIGTSRSDSRTLSENKLMFSLRYEVCFCNIVILKHVILFKVCWELQLSCFACSQVRKYITNYQCL